MMGKKENGKMSLVKPVAENKPYNASQEQKVASVANTTYSLSTKQRIPQASTAGYRDRNIKLPKLFTIQQR